MHAGVEDHHAAVRDPTRLWRVQVSAGVEDPHALPRRGQLHAVVEDHHAVSGASAHLWRVHVSGGGGDPHAGSVDPHAQHSVGGGDPLAHPWRGQMHAGGDEHQAPLGDEEVCHSSVFSVDRHF